MRFGVIGGGSMASYHAYNVTRMAGATLVAFASPEYAESATNLAQRVGAECLSDVDTLCRRADIDAVIIASPTDTHMQAAVSAAQHGKHLFVEKPLARTLADAEQIVTAAERYGVKLQPGHVVRYMADYALAHTMVTTGEIGTPAVVRTTRGGGFPGNARRWYADMARSGGVVLDLQIHDFDWLRWTFGEVERIYATGLITKNIECKDAAMAVLRFKSGVIGYAEASWAYPSGFRTTLEVSGSAGLVRNDSAQGQAIQAQFMEQSGATLAGDTQGHEDPYLAQLRDFMAWCQGGAAPRSTGVDGFEALRISLAALESIRSGVAVTLNQ